MISDTDLWSLLLIFVFIVVAILIEYLSWAARRRAWSNLADQAALVFTPGNFFGRGLLVCGVYHSHQLTMDTFIRRTGRSSQIYTRIVVSLNQPTSLRLDIHNERVFSKIGKALGMKEIQVGDEVIDQRYIIKGQPETAVASVMMSFDLLTSLAAAVDRVQR